MSELLRRIKEAQEAKKKVNRDEYTEVLAAASRHSEDRYFYEYGRDKGIEADVDMEKAARNLEESKKRLEDAAIALADRVRAERSSA